MAIERIQEHARRTPDKVAVIHDGIAFTYGAFAQRIAAARGFLAGCRIAPGSVAVTCFRSLFEAWIAGIALRSLGVTTIAARDANEAARFPLRNVGGVVTAAAERRPGLAALAAARDWTLARLPPDFDPETDPFAALSGVTASTPAGAHILRTSGTTGAYKMVMRDAAREAASMPTQAEIYGIDARSVVYVANFALWTAGGYRWPLITWSVGGTVVIQQRPGLYLPFTRHELTHAFATPEMLSTMLRAPWGAMRRNDAMRLIVTAGTMPRALLAQAQTHLTRRVCSMLASTEASAIAITPIERPDDLAWHRIHPLRHVDIVDETGAKLAAGEEGLIRVLVIDGLSGYVDDELATRSAFRSGYFYPGDLGVLAVDGRLSLRGRASDVVNVLGDKVATAPIERALEDRLGVEGVCFVTVPGIDADDEIHAVIQSKRRISPAEWDAAAKLELGPIKRVPVHVSFIERLPRNEMGKVKRLVLRRQLQAARRSVRAGATVAPSR